MGEVGSIGLGGRGINTATQKQQISQDLDTKPINNTSQHTKDTKKSQVGLPKDYYQDKYEVAKEDEYKKFLATTTKPTIDEERKAGEIQTVAHAQPQLDTETNVRDLATIIMSEASVGNNVERKAVAWTVRNRMERGNYTNVSDVSSAYATNQVPKPRSIYYNLAKEVLAANPDEDITNGSTHFFSPRSMPKEGDSTKGFDVKGGLIEVEGIEKKVYSPSWHLTMKRQDINGVRESFFIFYSPQ